MKRVPDRKKLRREYLAQKGGIAADLTVSFTLLLPLTFACVCFLLLAMTLPFAINAPIGERLGMFGLLLFLAGVAGLGVFMCVRDMRETKCKARHIPYVPPVTPKTLPAEEILVRGAEQPPVAQSDVLLRAATNKETPEEELLRATPDMVGM